MIFIMILLVLITLIYFSRKPKDDLPPFPIDVVYTWAGEQPSSNERLSYNGELKYSLRSIFTFAPWVNHVYIVMNPPKTKPSWFNDRYKEKITILDHHNTFKQKEHLPTTNSNSIETTLVNIPGLSEHYIYFNDDIFIAKPVSYLEFFDANGKIIIDQDQISDCSTNQLPNEEQIINFDLPENCNMSKHIPLPHKKTIVRKFVAKYKDYIEWVRNIKTRTGRGSKICYAHNLKEWCQQQHRPIAKFAYDNGNAVLKKNSPNDIIFVWNHTNNTEILNKIKNSPPMFFCINDKKFTDAKSKEMVYKEINDFLEEFYNQKPFFEK